MKSDEKSAPRQLRNFVFTWNNPGAKLIGDDAATEKAQKYIKYLYDEQRVPIKFITYGIEHGEKGTLHFQGYCELTSRLSFRRITEYFDNCHIEPRRGTQQQAIDYCRKGGVFDTFGEPKIQGDRSDLLHIKSLLDINSSIKTLLDDGVIQNAQALRLAQSLLRYTDAPRDYKPTVRWFYGASGTGKTREARSLLPHAYFKTNVSSRWWPNYDGEEDVIIDDLTPDKYSFIMMLGLLDRYPYQVEDKGTIREFRGRNIIITCTLSPEFVYEGIEFQGSLDQLTRRIDEKRKFKI